MDAAPGTATRPPPSHQDTNCNESVDMIERTRASWRYLEGGLRPSGAEKEGRRPAELPVAGGEETEGRKGRGGGGSGR